ncbi:cation:proton antiporter [Streptomyces chrestomyceticus]|uniref:cation:proton antiporter n=1 Tax=Streptomyces chrestomyceticus TaxID=68185 RepID=UPI0033DD3CE2
MSGTILSQFFLALALVLGCAKLFGRLARLVGQPRVVGEICAGLLASPMVLSPDLVAVVLPGEVKPLLSAVADIGLAAFMFAAGYELDLSMLYRRATGSLGLLIGSILCPLALGAAVALLLADRYAPANRTAFVLFVALAMSVTALPVLVRILSDRGLNGRPVGNLALGAAAVGDLTAWVCLAGVVAYAGGSGQVRVLLLPLYLVLLVVARPLLRSVVRASLRRNRAGAGLVSTVFLGLMLSCAVTEWLGIHFIFGALAFGAVMPRKELEELRGSVPRSMHQIGQLMLPPYFVLAGMNVDLSAVGVSAVAVIALVICTAMVSKIGGAYAGARISGIGHAEALPTALLMNTRGLTEIVIVAVALDAGIIDRSFYSVMVIMAIATTAMTGPLLTLFAKAPEDSSPAPVVGERAKKR